ncbi:MAG: CHC2 zinc finger domain-containing protein [Pseudomonadota bacterium]
MPAKRVNFKEVRESADFGAVLSSYGIEMIKDGQKEGQFKALCPFHDDQDPSMKVNTDRNIFNCFSCGEGGNVLDFVMKQDGSDVRAAALKVADIANVPSSPAPQRSKPKKRRKDPVADPKPDAEELDGVPYNKPLTFQLQSLATDHSFFNERAITDRMIKDFGLGIAQKGMMKDRLVFPIHNKTGELVAYCGRWVEEPEDDQPKYKQPPKFHKELELFNWHQAQGLIKKGQPLLIVESFLAVVKLHVWGFPVVSPMGRSLSDTQIETIKAAKIKSAILLFDGDDPGRDAIKPASRLLLDAGIHSWSPAVPADFKPHHLKSAKAAKKLLSPFLA